MQMFHVWSINENTIINSNRETVRTSVDDEVGHIASFINGGRVIRLSGPGIWTQAPVSVILVLPQLLFFSLLSGLLEFYPYVHQKRDNAKQLNCSRLRVFFLSRRILLGSMILDECASKTAYATAAADKSESSCLSQALDKTGMPRRSTGGRPNRMNYLTQVK